VSPRPRSQIQAGLLTGRANRLGQSGQPDDDLASEVAHHRHVSAEALRQELARGGCPLCRLLGPADDLLIRMPQARTLPPDTHQQVREARGFCTPHAWWLLGEAASRALPAEGLSRSVRDVLAKSMRALDLYGADHAEARLDPTVFRRTARHGWTKRVAGRLQPIGRCPRCPGPKRIQEHLGYESLALLRQDQLRAARGADAALCLPQWALQEAGEKAVLGCLVGAERARLESLLGGATRKGGAAELAHVAGAPCALEA
jgi:hypothetical protein